MRRPPADPNLAPDYEACRSLIQTGSRSFYTASLLLPGEVRAAAYALYAFCRLSDDAVDGPDAEADAADQLAHRLDLIYAGRPAACAADRAFADVVARFAMPKELPAALIEGLAWDSAGRKFQDISALYAYGARVAGTVGAMMTVLMGVREPRVLARACDLGVAMQLTNIARDVGEDARNGRVYLPLDWLAAEGVDPAAFVAEPVHDARIGRLVGRLLDLAERLYERSASGVSGLPWACRPAIHAARLIYREIGEEIRRAGLDSVSRRAVVSDARKLALLGQAVVASGVTPRAGAEPPLDETRFLVEAVPGWRAKFGETAFEDRVGFVIDLFGKLAERDRQARSAGWRAAPPAE